MVRRNGNREWAKSLTKAPKCKLTKRPEQGFDGWDSRKVVIKVDIHLGVCNNPPAESVDP